MWFIKPSQKFDCRSNPNVIAAKKRSAIVIENKNFPVIEIFLITIVGSGR